MVKLVTLVKRRAGIGRPELLAHWGRLDSALSPLIALRRRAINLAVVIPEREPRFDLVEETWWDDPEQVRQYVASPHWRFWWDEAAAMIEPERAMRLLVSERVLIAPPANAGNCVKTFNLVHRDAGRSFESFDRHWATHHAELVMKLPQLRGYVQCPVLDAYGRDDAPDGVPISWYDSVEAGRISMHSPQRRPIDLDEAGFVARERTVRVVTTETVSVR